MPTEVERAAILCSEGVWREPEITDETRHRESARTSRKRPRTRKRGRKPKEKKTPQMQARDHRRRKETTHLRRSMPDTDGASLEDTPAPPAHRSSTKRQGTPIPGQIAMTVTWTIQHRAPETVFPSPPHANPPPPQHTRTMMCFSRGRGRADTRHKNIYKMR